MTIERDQIKSLLQELAQRLHDAGHRASVRVVGGAALAFYYDRGATRDVDALLSPADAILAIAAEMVEGGLTDDWLNDKVAAFQSHRDEPSDWRLLVEIGEVEVYIAGPELLLAMKLLAGRGRRDTPDIDALVEICEVGSSEDVLTLFECYYPEEEIKPTAWRQIRAKFEGVGP